MYINKKKITSGKSIRLQFSLWALITSINFLIYGVIWTLKANYLSSCIYGSPVKIKLICNKIKKVCDTSFENTSHLW